MIGGHYSHIDKQWSGYKPKQSRRWTQGQEMAWAKVAVQREGEREKKQSSKLLVLARKMTGLLFNMTRKTGQGPSKKKKSLRGSWRDLSCTECFSTASLPWSSPAKSALISLSSYEMLSERKLRFQSCLVTFQGSEQSHHIM